MQITINLSRANVPLPKLVPLAAQAQALLSDPTVSVSLEIQLDKKRAAEVRLTCEHLKIPYTTYTPAEE